jgi:sugar/nucleoside kinase (ribokinase family)
MKYDFITIGGATLDIVFFAEDGRLIDDHKKTDQLSRQLLAFEFGSKVPVKKFVWCFGGGASNAAVNLSHLGLKTACLSSVGGDDYGRHIIANLKQHRVKTDLVRIIKKADSGFSFVLIGPKSERVIFTYRAANDDLTFDRSRCAALKKTENIYIGSLSGTWQKTLTAIFSVKGPKIYWNPGSFQYKQGLKILARYLRRTQTLFLNNEEALALVASDERLDKTFKTSSAEIKDLLKIIKSYGPKLVVITSGTNGADAFDGQKFYHQNIIKEKKNIDMTGIGDVYNSTMAAVLELTGDIKQAMLLAAKNSAAKVSRLGAQNGILSWRDLQAAGPKSKK